MKILVVENDTVLAGQMENYLKTEGHRCEIHHTPTPALFSAASHYYDSIVFNLNSLDQEEQTLLKFLRSTQLNTKTILTYTENPAVDHQKVEALKMPSLQKPYPLDALHSQLNAVQQFDLADQQKIMLVHELEVNIPAREAKVNNSPVELTRSEFDLLVYFINHKSKVLSKNVLAQYLSRNQETTSFDFGFLYAHVKNLKRKLKEAGCQDHIRNVYGIGYIFRA